VDGTPPSSTRHPTTTTSPASRGHSPPPEASDQEWKPNRRPGQDVTYRCGSPELILEVLRLLPVREAPPDRFDRAPSGVSVTVRVHGVRHALVGLFGIEQQ